MRRHLATALLAATSALVPPAAPRRRQALRARDAGVAHKIPIIEGEAVDPASDPSRPRWLYAPSKVPNASHWDVVLDARSPSEFEEDRMLGALSTPVLDDDERAEVGTLYASNSFQARVRGASLVANRLSKILQDDRITSLPRDARILVYCWRGGDRSGSLAHALSRIGWHVALLEGGYKAYRKLVREALYEDKEGELLRNCVAIGGATGSGKGLILDALSARGAQVVDLEGLASHRGSILGAMPDEKQPTQKHFESRLYNALRELDPSRPTFVELESAKIGRLDVPRPIFRRLIEAPVVEVRVPIQSRVAWIREGYAHFEDCGEGTAQLRRLLDFCAPTAGKKTVARWNSYIDEEDWDAFVRDMLESHYDVGYERSRARDRRNAGLSQEEPFHVDMASTRDDDVANCAAQILERFSRPKLRVAVHKPSRQPLTVMHASLQEGETGEVSADELTNEEIVKFVREEITDQEVNELVWRCLGYRRVDGAWNADQVFPKWAAKYPQPPDLIGVTRTYSKDVDEVVLRANQALVASIPMKYKGGIKEHLRKVGWTGYLLEGLTPNKTRRAQCANWVLYYREALFGKSLEELKKARERDVAAENEKLRRAGKMLRSAKGEASGKDG
jgi:tRNA 2-selenouridine synthase